MSPVEQIENGSQKLLADTFTDLPAKSPEMIRSACKLLSVLSRQDTLVLFMRIRDGLYSNKNSSGLLNLTRKQYYTRLRNLVDAGLVKKNGDSYTHTTFGSLIYENYLAVMLKGIRNFKHIQMIDALKESQGLSKDEVTDLMNVVLKENNS